MLTVKTLKWENTMIGHRRTNTKILIKIQKIIIFFIYFKGNLIVK